MLLYFIRRPKGGPGGASPGQDQQAVSAQDPGGQVLMNREAHPPGEPQQSVTHSLPTLEGVRREAAVQKLVATVFQGFKGCLFGEVMKVSVQLPTFQKPAFAQHGLDAQIQRDMKYLQLALRSDRGQEAEIVVDVLENVEDQHQVEGDAVLLRNVSQCEMESLVRAAMAHFQGLRRDVVTLENASLVHLLLQEPEHLACATTDITDRLRPQLVPLQHPENLV